MLIFWFEQSGKIFSQIIIFVLFSDEWSEKSGYSCNLLLIYRNSILLVLVSVSHFILTVLIVKQMSIANVNNSFSFVAKIDKSYCIF